MELAGLEPATSWVRSTRPFDREPACLQRVSGERLECRNISRNTPAPDLQNRPRACAHPCGAAAMTNRLPPLVVVEGERNPASACQRAIWCQDEACAIVSTGR
jgi:hypothetical protein